ncbi:MAG: hypothetical protein IH597_00005 [Bacteroidales bacterium]|nr:hypothetical protein [Bacteroidales bacterium]
MDFTFNTYKQLLQTLQSQGYAFTTLADYMKSETKLSPEVKKSASAAAESSNPLGGAGGGAVEFPPPLGGAGGGAPDTKSNNLQPSTIRNRQSKIVNPKLILLRHDVEARYPNALRFAQIQHAMGIRGSYYFRLYPKPRNTRFIRSIADLGHEIGYHYDDLSFCKGNHDHAIIRFEQHLDFLRTIAPVETITMEGAPLSSYDNRALWEKFDYKAYGILAEPYFDLNFGTDFSQSRHPDSYREANGRRQTPNPQYQTSNAEPRTPNPETVNSTGSVTGPRNDFFYLTDTGRRWDGWKVSLRDKVPQQDEWIKQGLVFHSTADIIKAANKGKLPDHIMMTFHPQRWNNVFLPWAKELVFQNAKNVVKYLLVYVKR